MHDRDSDVISVIDTHTERRLMNERVMITKIISEVRRAKETERKQKRDR